MEENRAKTAIMKEHRFIFTGNTLTFFKIWIVNMFLSIITLGIYSPWAKVRNNHYIYGSTTLNELPFEYTAKPLKILIGRLIVVGFYVVYLVLAEVLGMQTFAMGFLGCFFLLIPFLVRQAVSFKMRYTRYSGVNFHHLGTVFDYYKYFIIYGILNIVTLGLAIPYSIKQFKALLIGKTSYGDTKFDFKADFGEFYMAYLKSFLVGFIPVVIFVIFIVLFSGVSREFLDELNVETMSNTTALLLSLAVFGVYATLLMFGTFTKGMLDAWIGNIVYNNTSLASASFKATWSPWKLGWISFSNVMVMMLTLGLMYPWAKIRTLKYKLANTYMCAESLDAFIDSKKDEPSALGEESADFFDVDVGI